MKTPTRVLFISIMMVLVTILLVISGWVTVQNFEKHFKEIHVANSLAILVYERHEISEEYMLEPKEELKSDWFTKTQEIKNRLQEVAAGFQESNETQQYSQLITLLNKSDSLFQQIVDQQRNVPTSSVGAVLTTELRKQLYRTADETIEKAQSIEVINYKDVLRELQFLIIKFASLLVIFSGVLGISFVTILRNVTNLEKEKQKVQGTVYDLEKYHLAVENATDQIVFSDPDGKIIYANRATEQITGYAINDALGKEASELWGGQMGKVFYENMWRTIKTEKKLFIGQITNKRKDGTDYVIEIHISPVLDAAKNVIFFVAISRDITKEKEIDRMKTEFISLASHQLRTPLSAMKWFSEMLLNGDAGSLNEEQKKFMQNIADSNERMIRLVNSLLNISRIESGRILIDPKLTDYQVLVRKVVEQLTMSITEKKQQIDIQIAENLPQINLDEKLVSEVIANLLTNAVKYTPPEGKITVQVNVKDQEMVTQISDTGYGILEKDKPRVFEKFFRGENIVKVETDGTGLGLYLVKAVVDSSGGKLWFESQEGKGTTFWFTLPLKGMEAKKGEVTLSN